VSVVRCKLLCAECGELRKLKAIEDGSALLDGGHIRASKLLPLIPGRISIENVRTAIGDRCFPYDFAGADPYRWRLV
jgi:hypothetical protein